MRNFTEPGMDLETIFNYTLIGKQSRQYKAYSQFVSSIYFSII